ncbi:MAG: hypothetical protein QOE66_2602 [Chloroflexota bacterium]|nr:hypothetical protein [Chloroflexota bacterium]
METSLHRQLKERYGPAAGGRLEVTLEGFRIDAVAADGALIEVQSGPLGPLKAKLRRLLPAHRVRVIKPVVLRRRLVRRTRRDGADLPARLSPKRGTLADVFDDLVGVAPLFPHPNLGVDVLAVEIDEFRLSRRRGPGYTVLDRRLRSVVASVALRQPRDLWALLPDDLAGIFTTRDLADHLGRSLDFAQRVAYCLRLTGAVEIVGKRGNHRVYAIPCGPSQGV